jgi:hypothetical protein
MNGVNKTFTLTYPPLPNSLALYLNGMYLTPAVDYALVELTRVITMVVAPVSTDKLRAHYLR